MTEQTKPETPHAGASSDAESGIPEFQPTSPTAAPEDPQGPASKPQGTLQDQEENMDSEGHLVTPPAIEAG